MSAADDSPPIDELIEQHLPALRAFVRLRSSQKIRDRESHSDVVQSVCREVLEGADRFEYENDAAFKGWLFTTALRKLVERDRYYHRQRRDANREVRMAHGGGSQDGERALVDLYATVTTPSMVLSAREQMEQLESAFDELTDEHREIVTLSKIAGLSHAEIAAQLGKSEEASRQLLRRAMIRLSMALEKRGQDS